jgi:hypothetical protein
MENVIWQQQLTATIQDDRYRRAIDCILARSPTLSRFATDSTDQPPCEPAQVDTHLGSRAIARMYSYRSLEDDIYHPCDHRKPTPDRAKYSDHYRFAPKVAFKFVNYYPLGTSSRKIPGRWRIRQTVRQIPIHRLVGIDLGVEWGALACTAIASDSSHKFDLIFFFAVITFSSEANMDLLQVLICFALYTDLKILNLPQALSFSSFKVDEEPTVKYLATLMNETKVPHIPIAVENNGQRGKLALARINHGRDAEQHCIDFANYVRDQWPLEEIKLDTSNCPQISGAHFNVQKALKIILPEWSRLVCNYELCKHLEEVQLVLDRHNTGAVCSDTLRTATQTAIQTLGTQLAALICFPSEFEEGRYLNFMNCCRNRFSVGHYWRKTQ